MHKTISVIEVTSEGTVPHDEAVLRDPDFQALHLAHAQAIANYTAAKLGVPAPTLTAKVLEIRHEVHGEP